MAEVVLAGGGEGILATSEAADEDQGRVEDGKRQDENGNHPGDAGAVHRETQFDGDGGQQEAEKEATGIAHEYTGRIPVIDQKAHAGAAEGSGQCTYEVLTAHGGEEGEEGGGDSSDSAGESIHIVEQVESVGNSDDPEECQNYVQSAVEEADLDTADHEDSSGGELDGELQVALHTAPVVQGTGQTDNGCANEDADDLIHVGTIPPEGQGGDKREVDGGASHERDGRGVDLATGRMVEDAETQGGEADQRCTADGNYEGAGGHQ